MSAKIMGMVFDLDLPSNEKFVLLAYADHADHQGRSIYPSVELVARKTGYSERSVQRLTRILEKAGYLIPEGGQKGGRSTSARWRIPMDGDKIVPVKKGDNLAPFKKGDKSSKRVTSETERVTSATLKGDIAMSPKPSLTIKEPFVSQPPEPPPKEEPQLTPQQFMVKILEEVTGLDSRINGSRLGRVASQLIRAKIDTRLVQQAYNRNGWWYLNDWRGKKGQPPLPEEVAETIGRVSKVEETAKEIPRLNLLCGVGERLFKLADRKQDQTSLQEYIAHIRSCRICSGASNLNEVQSAVQGLAQKMKVH